MNIIEYAAGEGRRIFAQNTHSELSDTVVYKPTSTTPFSAVKLTIFEESGLPSGMLNLATGPEGSIGNKRIEDSRVGGIAFTVST